MCNFCCIFAPDFKMRKCGLVILACLLIGANSVLGQVSNERLGTGVERRAVGILIHGIAGVIEAQCARRFERQPQRWRHLHGYVQSCVAACYVPHDAPTQLFLLSARHDVRFRPVRA